MKKFIMLLTVVILAISTTSTAAFASTTGTKDFKSFVETGVATSEVLVGTEENWSKLKIINGNGNIEFIVREVVNGKDSFKIFSESNTQTHSVTSDNKGNILVDGKELKKEELELVSTKVRYNTEIGINADQNPGSGFYLISKTYGSYASDWNTLATGVAVLVSIFGGMASGVATSLVSYIISENIPNVWYVKRKYSDKAVYRPVYKIYTTHYADPARTQYIKTADYIL